MTEQYRSAVIIVLPLDRSVWDMCPSDCEPVNLAGIMGGRPPRSKPWLAYDLDEARAITEGQKP